MNYFRDIYYMISYIYVLLFIYLFIPHRYTKRKTVLICFSSFLLLTLPNYLKLHLYADSSLCYLLVTVFQILLTQSTALLIARTRDNRSLFLGLSASNYVIAGSITACIVHIYINHIPLALAGCIAVHTAILIIMYVKIRDICLSFCERKPVKSHWELCLIPVFFFCGFSSLAFFPYTFYDNPKSIPGAVFFLITMFVSYVVVLRYLQNELSSADIYWKNALFESQIKSLENQYRLAEQSAEGMRILRHDMRHYSGMIDSFLAQKEYDKIRELTRHINEMAEEHRFTSYCQNIIVNSVLSDMTETARSFQIDLSLDALVPSELPVNAYELASTVANLLETALYCAKELPVQKRRVDVHLNCAADHLLIETSNEYEKEIVFDPLTGLPESTRGKNHGFGIKSASAFSDKIGGQFGCYCEGSRFHVLMVAKF